MTDLKPRATPAKAAPKPLPKSANRVIVASKLPMDLTIQLCRKTARKVQGRYGAEEEIVHVPDGPAVVIRGTGRPAGQIPKGYKKLPEVLDEGFALTPNVDADFFAEWLDQHRDADYVRNGMIFAHSSRDEVEGVAQDNEALKSGLDPIDADGDPRMPKSLDQNVGKLEKAEI